ncbi:MAG: UbiA family prenyltransferase [Chloroflexi bacterium]|nr:UbiA family prenyltransferase [Chloroflexota bacterium]MCH9018530.1 UbiA family prenyltransferase [Chloroflexota bacterium]MCI0809921.1 UbiA family prenyltransferase [Chloroflexota bacterium]MCI0847584.1 UbiA family prenyltransferase [Chloroflexota bacterium]MCI0897233.1 UbiA family prenyltransferase [Chloroflexota bacterium]
MSAARAIKTPAGIIATRVPRYLSTIRIWESLYALPFCFIGMVLAADGWPGWSVFIWITVALTGVRTLGMAANRFLHREEDVHNPRTANRHLPTGKLKPFEVFGLMVLGTGVFFYAAAQLNGLALALAPVAAAYVVLYSFAKYHTWACHFLLGWALAISPSAAWIAVTGRLAPEAVLLSVVVALWAGGFDIVYGCADIEFDKKYGVNSLPKRFGVAAALRTTRVMHAGAAAALLILGFWMDLSFYYFIGWAIAVSLLAVENWLLKPGDLSKLRSPLFQYNSVISMVLLLFTVLAVEL